MTSKNDAIRHAVLMGMDAFRICMGKPTRNFDAAEVVRWMGLMLKDKRQKKETRCPSEKP